MSAVGGAALAASAVLGWLILSAREEGGLKADDLDAATANVNRINGAKISPTAASVEAIEANRAALADWRSEALALASKGDFSVDAAMTPEAFKRTMVEGARELSKLPGAVGGKLVKDEFAFGFKDFVTGSAIPESDKVPLLQRQWREIRLFTETLAACGAAELLDVTVVEKAAEPEPEETQSARSRRRPRKDVEERKDPVTSQSYVLKFLARPVALVKTVNAFAVSERFVAVDSFEFARERDTLSDVMGGEKEKESAGGRRGRNRRRQSAEAAAETEENNKKGLVTDPEMDLPFVVTMKLTTYDFGNASAASEEAAGKEEEE